jgi:hypothetical protein
VLPGVKERREEAAPNPGLHVKTRSVARGEGEERGGSTEPRFECKDPQRVLVSGPGECDQVPPCSVGGSVWGSVMVGR